MVDAYSQIAAEVLAKPQVLQKLADWFDSDKPRSAIHFGAALGQLDQQGAASDTILSWMQEGRCREMVVGYLDGLSARLGAVPQSWLDRLDGLAGQHPEYAAALTLQADVSAAGMRRVLSLVTSNGVPASCLNGFGRNFWSAKLSDAEKAGILSAVLCMQDRDRAAVTNLGLNLLAAWTKYGHAALPELLTQPAIQFLGSAVSTRVDPRKWAILLDLFATTRPSDAVQVALDVLTSPTSARVELEDSIVQSLCRVARSHPDLVMERLGECLLDKQKRAFFGVFHFRGLFEAIGLPPLQNWVLKHGSKLLRYIARHLPSPHLKDGEPKVPAVTEWVLSQFQDDDVILKEFCHGRHAGEVMVGYAHERRSELERAVRPFLSHPLRRIREWAEWELKENERDAKRDEHLDEFLERL